VVSVAILRKIKEKLKKIIKKGKASMVKEGRKEKVLPQETRKEEILGSQETAVERAKFSHPEAGFARRHMPVELPSQYGRDTMILQVRDPRWLHSYWEVGVSVFDRLKRELGDYFYKARRVLRVYDVTQINFNGSNANSFFDIEINDYASNWYIDTNGPGKSWCVDLGLLLSDGRFIMILRSNIVQTPLEGPSWITDEEWMIPEDMFARLYGMGFGLGQSSPVGKAWQERVKQAFFSGSLSSAGIASMASPTKKEQRQRKFWMMVDCELIVYGATEPDAKVTVQDKEIKLRPDGTFTLRFALPDGRQVIPVKAVSSDNIEERTITPIVSRETKSSSLLKS
jgi:uncharacterized protein